MLKTVLPVWDGFSFGIRRKNLTKLIVNKVALLWLSMCSIKLKIH